MEAAEIIRQCLERGILVSDDDIRRIEAGLSLEEFMASGSAGRQPEQAGQHDDAKSGRMVCRVKKPDEKTSVTPADIIEARRKKYESLKSMLLPKASAVSIANAADSRIQIAVIGVVKARVHEGFTLEDPTGEIEVLFSGKQPSDGDVVCCRGPVSAGKMKCRDVLLPDVPLLRPVGKIEATALFGNTPEHAAGADIVISAEEVKSGTKSVVLSASPSQLTMHRDGAKVSVLFFKPEKPTGPQDAVSMLKRRWLDAPLAGVEPFVIDPVPDVLWLHGKGTGWTGIYKGVLIVHTGEKGALVNLETKEVKFV